jgi:hypothetical protein
LIPNLATAQAVMKYEILIKAQFAPMLGQNPTPARSIAGRSRKIGSDGRKSGEDFTNKSQSCPFEIGHNA